MRAQSAQKSAVQDKLSVRDELDGKKYYDHFNNYVLHALKFSKLEKALRRQNKDMFAENQRKRQTQIEKSERNRTQLQVERD